MFKVTQFVNKEVDIDMVALSDTAERYLREWAEKHHSEFYNLATGIETIEAALCPPGTSIYNDDCRIIGDVRRMLVTLADRNINEL